MSLTQTLDALLHAATDNGRIPGVVATVADRSGVIYEGAAGVRAAGGNVPMTVDTFAWYASLTKGITAAAAMQLVEQGRLSLDAPAADVLPELGRVQVRTGWDANGQPRLRPPKSPMTLRQLLTHTSGFAYEIFNADVERELREGDKGYVLAANRQTMDRALVCDPGTAWHYSIGLDWVGRMVEAVSGQRLRDYFAQQLFAPLGIRDMSFVPNAEQKARASAMHARLPDGTITAIPFELPAEPELDMGGHGLSGSLPDYLRFCRAILNGGVLDGQRILSPTTVELMGRNHMGALTVPALSTAMPTLSNDCDLHPGITLKWGLSFIINEQPLPEGRAAGSMAWAGLPNAYYWIDRTTGITAALSTQIMPFWDGPVTTLRNAFERAIYDALD